MRPYEIQQSSLNVLYSFPTVLLFTPRVGFPGGRAAESNDLGVIVVLFLPFSRSFVERCQRSGNPLVKT